MNGSLKAELCAVIFSLGLASTANATLELRLGGQAYYDTELDISWLANANAGAGSSFDDGFSSTDGRMSFGNANDWAASLNIDGVTGWRLPTADVNGDDTIVNCSGGGVVGCSDNEMGFLFWEEGITAKSPLPFIELRPAPYRLRDPQFVIPQQTSGLLFSFDGGAQTLAPLDGHFNAWAVHAGDVGESSMPEPGTIALMGLGLAGLLGFGRRQRRR